MTGWFAVAWSDEIPKGGVEPLVVAGRAYVLYRGEDGAPRALDAHCRHLGAHMGYGGGVEGNALRCPFHGWRWEGDGVCSDVPYARRVPAGARIGAWPCRDRSGVVCLWTGAEPPPRELPEWLSDPEAWGPETRLRMHRAGGLDEVVARFLDAPQLDALAKGRCTTSRPSDALLFHRIEAEVEAAIGIYPTPIDVDRVDVRIELRARPQGPVADALLASLRKALEEESRP